MSVEHGIFSFGLENDVALFDLGVDERLDGFERKRFGLGAISVADGEVDSANVVHADAEIAVVSVGGEVNAVVKFEFRGAANTHFVPLFVELMNEL